MCSQPAGQQAAAPATVYSPASLAALPDIAAVIRIIRDGNVQPSVNLFSLWQSTGLMTWSIYGRPKDMGDLYLSCC
jgi:hypothetical protein